MKLFLCVNPNIPGGNPNNSSCIATSSTRIVSVLHQEEGGIGKSIPDAQDFPRPERFPEGEARGKSRGSREIWRAEGMDFPIPPEFWWSTDNLSASIFLQGVDQKILPCGQGRIDSVKINPSLLMMTDCGIQQCLRIHHLPPS